MTRTYRADILVAGGGFAGVAAAVAAAREGLSVLLLEKNQTLGGSASHALVSPFMRYYIEVKRDGVVTGFTRLNTGLFSEILRRMADLDGPGDPHRYDTFFNVEYLKFVLENLCEEHGVRVLYGTTVTGADTEDGRILRLHGFNRDGFSDFEARYFLDCTGDADVAVLSGAPFRLGREGDHLCQPMTLCFWLSHVDMDKFREEEPLINPLYDRFRREGRIRNEREDVLIFSHVSPGVLHFNTTRVTRLDPTSEEDVTRAQFEARRQVFEMYNFLRRNFSAFRDSVLLMSAPEIGIRESRMIEGDYVYTKEDILQYRVFEDSIACGCYEIDIHNPDGTGTEHVRLDGTRYYTIPYRSLIPRGVRNLLVAGRCISSTHEAQSAYRIMPIVCNIGEGAGTAAAVAAADGTDLRSVDIGRVHTLLDRHGMRYR